MAVTITDGVITADDYRYYSGATLPGNGTVLEAQWGACMTVASRWAERSYGREFHQPSSNPNTPTARYFDPTGAFVYIDDARSVTLVESCDDAGTYTTVDASAYQILPVGGRDPILGDVPFTKVKALRWGAWSRCTTREGIVRVTGTWGWSAVPADVVRAVCMVVEALLKDKDSLYGDGTVLDPTKIPPRAAMLMAPFNRLERTMGFA